MEQYEVTDFASLIKRVKEVGQQLTLAQPKELAVGNIVRRVLGVIRLEAEENRDVDAINVDSESRWQTLGTVGHDGQGKSTFQEPSTTQTSTVSSSDRPPLQSMFNLLSHPNANTASPTVTPGDQSPKGTAQSSTTYTGPIDLGAEVGEAIEEIIEELETADDQIAGYALEHIHSSEITLTYGPSVTVQKFLLKAAAKRKFTVIHAESFPNNHESVHATVSGSLKGNADGTGPDRFHKSLTAAGITVILIPDSAIFAVMSRVNKVILGTHAVLANGGLIAAAGAKMLAKAASMHKTPVLVLSGIYKLSPIYPFDTDALIEYGDSGKVVPYEDGEFMEKVDVENPLHDYVPPELIDLYITNL